MRRRMKSVLAVLLTFLMVFGIIPTNFSNISVKAAEAPEADGDVSAFILDASKLSADDFGGFGTKITQDMTLGTNGFFTLYAKSSKNSLADLSSTPLEAPNGTYTQAINLGGQVKNTYDAALGFTVDRPATLKAYVAVKAVNATKHSFQMGKDGAKPATAFEMVNDTTVVNEIVLDLEAGNYLIGGDNGGNFLYVEVVYKKPCYVMDGEELSADLFGDDNKLLANGGVGEGDFLHVTTAGGKVQRKTGQSIVYGDKTYTTSLRLDGAPNFAENKKQSTVEFTTPNPVRVTMLAAKKGSKDSQLQYSSDCGATKINIGDEQLTTADVMVEYIFELPAGTHQIGGTQGVDIFRLEVQEIEFYEVTGATIPDTIEVGTNISTDTAVGTDGFFTIVGRGGKIKISTSPALEYDGITYDKTIYINGAAKANGQGTISFTTTQSSRITVLAAAKSDAASTFQYSCDGSAFVDVGALDFTAVQEYMINDAKPGTYMIGGTNGCNIASIKVEYDPLDLEVTPWEEVPAPVITKVEADEEGKLIVSFDAAIDKYAGAEKVTIIMMESGYEFASIDVTSQSTTSVVFTPIWNEDYTFKAVAQRKGEANKESEEYEYKNYILPVKKPIVELAQNRGNGTVYLDWINVEAADYFNAYYKESGTEAYTQVVDGSAVGHKEFTGLTPGKSYDFKIEAVRTLDGYKAVYELNDFAVTADAEQKWYFGIVGSAQETDAVVYNADGSTAKEIYMAVKDDTVNKVGITDPEMDIVNTNKSIYFEPHGNGKISDGEEGFQYYYTMIDPNTQNFELTATFEVTKQFGNAWDNQSGYGIIATDMLGYNYYETDGLWIKHKQLNSVSTQQYATRGFVGQRNISGYISCDTTSVTDVTRVTEETKFNNTPAATDVGTKYTFTLKKTDDAWVSVLNGEEISYDNLAICSVQEDGSLCIGVFAARNAGVTITDIKFSTSESAGVKAVEKEDKITPNAAILSSGTANSSTYELIYHPNAAGKLVVTAPDGTVVYNDDVNALDVVRVPVPVTVGMNEIKSQLIPDQAQALTSYDSVNKTTKVEYQVIGNVDDILYVASNGTPEGDGTRENPLDIYTAVKYAQPGQYIVLLSGEYTGSNITIGRSVSGTEDKPITMVAEEVNGVRFKGIGLSVTASYWHIYGIYVDHPSAVGIQISGNYNVIEMCTVEASGNTGIQISRSGSVDREAGLANLLWPSYNLVKNCESFDNCDAGRNDADGFAAKLTSGEGNTFYGCIAHNNIDDGWDLFAKAISGEIGKVTIENCVAYNNGWLTNEDTTVEGYEYGEGNGFKLGGNDMYGGHVLINSVSFNNMAKGITSNSCPDCEVYDSTSYGNAIKSDALYSVDLQTKATNHQRWNVEGLISMTTYTDTADQIPFALSSPSNFIFNGKQSVNSEGVEADTKWFESVDVSIVPTRNEDGTINMHGLLVPTDECPENAGARIDTSAAASSPLPMVVNGVDYSKIFDADYYRENNADVVEVFGADVIDLFTHFITYGIPEGRKGVENFDVNIYKLNYEDLRGEFGDDTRAYYKHYAQYGLDEGRVANTFSVLNGLDYSAVYDAQYYAEHNSDVVEAFGDDPQILFAHFVQYGMKEGRIANDEFNINAYKNNYGDLIAAFGDDNEKYYAHYCEHGKAEGRNAQTMGTINAGVEYRDVFDAEYYAANYPDVVQSEEYGSDEDALFRHFVEHGMAEGRQANAEFDVELYKSNYPDLERTFGDDKAAYYKHYAQYGKEEGRTGAEVDESYVENITIYDGVDYGAVFNAEYYYAAYEDMQGAFGKDAQALLKHFVEYGMSEYRQAKADFNAETYRNNYDDLGGAFGDDWKAYYTHYMQYGIAEGRTGATAIEKPVPPQESTTVLDGVDYALVFDAEYYAANYEDVAQACANAQELLEHFVEYGMSEHRQAKADFNAETYRSNYADLDGTYGDDWNAYYMHYMQWGAEEGRTGAAAVEAAE